MEKTLNIAAAESLRSFLFARAGAGANSPKEIEFAHLLTTAILAASDEDYLLSADGWAIERVFWVVRMWEAIAGTRLTHWILDVVRAHDTSRPDGATAKGGISV